MWGKTDKRLIKKIPEKHQIFAFICKQTEKRSRNSNIYLHYYILFIATSFFPGDKFYSISLTFVVLE
jgi:hypothetical protein